MKKDCLIVKIIIIRLDHHLNVFAVIYTTIINQKNVKNVNAIVLSILNLKRFIPSRPDECS